MKVTIKLAKVAPKKKKTVALFLYLLRCKNMKIVQQKQLFPEEIRPCLTKC